jgi:prolyl-tRNA synthetase
VREFIMKDSYSFDRDEEGLDVNFRNHREAYKRILERCGIAAYDVQGEPGMMGGSESVDFLAPAAAGENTLVTCANGDYAADLEVARGVPRAPAFPERLEQPQEVETPGVTTIEALADFLGIDPAATAKAMPVTTLDGRLVLGLIRGDDRLEEAKLASTLGAAFRPATEEEIRAGFGADPGSIGPVGFNGDVIADETLRQGQFVAGANKTGRHLRGVEHGRDFEARVADLRRPNEGEGCPDCGGALQFQAAIEVGHIFKLETRYTEPMGARFVDEDGKERPLIMGSYGLGPGRAMAAAVEQHHDEHGIAWPEAIAPYEVHVVALAGAEEVAERAAAAIEARGRTVLLDDRDQRAGEKFADADLIGCPVRVTAGKKSLEDDGVDIRDRATGEERRVSVDDL